MYKFIAVYSLLFSLKVIKSLDFGKRVFQIKENGILNKKYRPLEWAALWIWFSFFIYDYLRMKVPSNFALEILSASLGFLPLPQFRQSNPSSLNTQ